MLSTCVCGWHRLWAHASTLLPFQPTTWTVPTTPRSPRMSLYPFVQTYLDAHPMKAHYWSLVLPRAHITVHIYAWTTSASAFVRDKVWHRTCVWLLWLDSCTRLHTSKNVLYLYLWLTPLRKRFPSTPPITEEHMNTGVTNTVDEILVYRREEWWKVLMHESIHLFHLDFATLDTSGIDRQLHAVFRGVRQSETKAYEAYCETWAELLHLSALCTTSTSMAKLVEEEQLFALHQLCVVLHYHGLQYTDLFHPTTQYTERTNVFAYLVLRCILLVHVDLFLTWCQGQLTVAWNPSTILSFGTLLTSLATDPAFHTLVQECQQHVVTTRLAGKSLRMTCIDK